MFQSYFTAFRARRGWLLSAVGPQGAILVKTGSQSTGAGLRQPDMVHRELLIATSTFFTCGLLLQTGAQCSAAGSTRACVKIRSVLAEAPQVVPARRRMSETLDVTFPATSSRCCLKSASGPDARQGNLELAETPGVCNLKLLCY